MNSPFTKASDPPTWAQPLFCNSWPWSRSTICLCPVCNGTGVMPKNVMDARRQAGLLESASQRDRDLRCIPCSGTGAIK